MSNVVAFIVSWIEYLALGSEFFVYVSPETGTMGSDMPNVKLWSGVSWPDGTADRRACRLYADDTRAPSTTLRRFKDACQSKSFFFHVIFI